MSEDDTFNALKRLPLQEILKTTVGSNNVLADNTEIFLCQMYYGIDSKNQIAPKIQAIFDEFFWDRDSILRYILARYEVTEELDRYKNPVLKPK